MLEFDDYRCTTRIQIYIWIIVNAALIGYPKWFCQIDLFEIPSRFLSQRWMCLLKYIKGLGECSVLKINETTNFVSSEILFQFVLGILNVLQRKTIANYYKFPVVLA